MFSNDSQKDKQNVQMRMQSAIASQFFQNKGLQKSKTLESIDLNVQEVEDCVNESVATMYWDDNKSDNDDLDNVGNNNTSLASVKSAVKKLHSKASARLQRSPSIYVHQTLALTLNLIALCNSAPFLVFPQEYQLSAVLTSLSIVIAYRYFYGSMRTYEIFNFEEVYRHMKNNKDYTQRKNEQPRKYYFAIIRYFSDKFPGVIFEYKLRSRDYELVQPSIGKRITKQLAKILKNLRRTFLPCLLEDLSEAFIKDTKKVKVLKATFWASDEVKLTYFIFLNPILMVAFMSGSYYNIILDALFLFIVSIY